MEGSLAFNPYDDREAAEFADTSFVGRVVGSAGHRRPPDGFSIPHSQFSVQVLAEVEGTASGRVTVNQYGGLEPATNRLFLARHAPLLEPGQTVVLAGRYSPSNTWYHTVTGARLLVEQPGDQGRLVARFAQAVAAGPERRVAPTPAP